MISIDKKKNNGSGNGNGSHGIALDKDKRRPLFHRNGKEKTQSYDYMDVLPAPVVVIDKEYTIKYANAAGAEALGRSKEDCIGQKCHDLFKFPSAILPSARHARCLPTAIHTVAKLSLRLHRVISSSAAIPYLSKMTAA